MDFRLDQKGGLMGKNTYYLADGWNQFRGQVKLSMDRQSAQLLDEKGNRMGAVRVHDRNFFNRDRVMEIAAYNQPSLIVTYDERYRWYRISDLGWKILLAPGHVYIDKPDGRRDHLETIRGRNADSVTISVTDPDDMAAAILIWAGFQLDHEEIFYASSTRPASQQAPRRTAPPRQPIPPHAKTVSREQPSPDWTPKPPVFPYAQQEQQLEAVMEEVNSQYDQINAILQSLPLPSAQYAALQQQLDQATRSSLTYLARAKQALHLDEQTLRDNHTDALSLAAANETRSRQDRQQMEKIADQILKLEQESGAGSKSDFDRQLESIMNGMKDLL